MKYRNIISALSAVVLYFYAAVTSFPLMAYNSRRPQIAEATADGTVSAGDITLIHEVISVMSQIDADDIFNCCSELYAQAAAKKTEQMPEDPEPEGSEPPAATSKLIEVEAILQLPELPTGCEVTSLAIVLNHLGYSADKLTLARVYLPKMDFCRSKGVLYGADFRTTFAGDPESEHSYGCFAPCIAETADRYLKVNGSDCEAVDITGTDLDTLFSDYIDNDIPVIIWITSDNLHETKLTDVWLTPEGEKVQWTAYEHCVVLTGYNKTYGAVFVSDPLIGNVGYSMDRLRERYEDMGRQAVYIAQPQQAAGQTEG